MKQKKCKDALITAYRIDNQELRRSIGEEHARADKLLRRAYSAEVYLAKIIEVTDILLNQNNAIDEEVCKAENEWRRLVDEWRQR